MYLSYLSIHSQYFPDRYIRREINKLEVVCPNSEAGCDWEGKLQEYGDHCRTCKFLSSTCPLSILGCSETSMSKAEMQQHLATHSGEHLSLLVNKIVALEEQCSPSNSRVRGVESSLMSSRVPDIIEMDGAPLWPRVQSDSGDRARSWPRVRADSEIDGARSRTRVQPDSGFDETMSPPTSLVPSMPSKYALEMEDPNVPRATYPTTAQMEESMRTLMIDVFGKQEEEIKLKLKSKDDEITSLKAMVTKLEKTMRTKQAEIEDRDFRLSLIENSNHDGSMIWKIPQFSQRRADAQNGKYTSIFSLPFYSGRYGYKMCLRLYIMGDGIGKGTHLSLFFVVMRGEFDNILQWPFTHKVTFKLINQAGGRDIVDTFQPDPMSSSFRKPKSDMNIASGCPRFVSHTELERGGFIVDDTVFIKCMIDTSTIRHP